MGCDLWFWVFFSSVGQELICYEAKRAVGCPDDSGFNIWSWWDHIGLMWSRTQRPPPFRKKAFQRYFAAWDIFQFRNHRVGVIEQNGQQSEAFEPPSLFDVSLHSSQVENVLSWSTIRASSYWSPPKTDPLNILSTSEQVIQTEAWA